MTKKVLSITIVVLINITVFSGCSDKEYDNFTIDFKKTYFEIVETIDASSTSEDISNLRMQVMYKVLRN